jgi:hypothetical protein
MITNVKLQIYKRYKGRIEPWISRGLPYEQKVMKPEDWTVISQLVGDLQLIEQGTTNTAFEQQVEQRLEKHCSNEDTIENLKSIAFFLGEVSSKKS